MLTGSGVLITAGAITICVVGYVMTSRQYVEVEATVQDVKVDCFIEARKSKIVERSTNALAYMDCDQAPAVAARFGYESGLIRKRYTLAYGYTSPVDRAWHRGEDTDVITERAYEIGDTIKVRAHASVASRSRLSFRTQAK